MGRVCWVSTFTTSRMSTDTNRSGGGNPFADFSFGERNFSSVVNVYDPPYALSTHVYAYIANNIADWVEEAIRTRGRY